MLELRDPTTSRAVSREQWPVIGEWMRPPRTRADASGSLGVTQLIPLGMEHQMNTRSWRRFVIILGTLAFGGVSINSIADPAGGTVTEAAARFLQTLSAEQRNVTVYEFDDPERFAFRWTPGRRSGITLGALSAGQNDALKALMHHIVSHAGQERVDAILAAEAALGVLTSSPEYRDPRLYYTTVFGAPRHGQRWGLRFEGHHLSINMTFVGERIVSASPLFLGANPETIPEGPDKGLRPLGIQVDLARQAFAALSTLQKKLASGSNEWFAGFLTSAGSRRAKLGKPAGISVLNASPDAQKQLKLLVADYVRTITERYADGYMEWFLREEWPTLYFFWNGGANRGETYYWRLQGSRLLVEHDGLEGGRHIHSIWRDAREDFGG